MPTNRRVGRQAAGDTIISKLLECCAGRADIPTGDGWTILREARSAATCRFADTVDLRLAHILCERQRAQSVVMTLTAATSTALRRYVSISGRSVAASAPAGMRSPAALVQQQTRGFAVVNLSDESAVEKFRNINSKSVLYFTAR